MEKLLWVPNEEESESEEYAGRVDPKIPKAYEGVPPLRAEIFTADNEFDPQRVEYQKKLWRSQDALLRGRDRQVEENIRMLCGQHWTIWNEVLGRYVDITKYLNNEEKRWRQLPVINRLLLWFMLLHARLTENPPIIAFQPATSDRSDAELAEVMDTVWKTLWHQAHMNEVIDDLVSWMIPGGRAYLKNRIDPDAGDFKPYTAPGALRLLGPDGQPILGEGGVPIERYLDAAPYSKEGQPLTATMLSDGTMIMPEPHSEREGGIVVDALSALEVRSEWGPKKFHRKHWHLHRTYCTPEEIYRHFGVEVAPEVFGDEADALAELQRLHFGAGYYGQAGGREEIQGTSSAAKEGFVEVFEGWYRPCSFPGMERTPKTPGGRLLITTRSKCLRDGARYAPFPHTSPIHSFDFVNVPGRPQGTSPQEMMNGPARTRNRLYGQILQHTGLVSNPIKLIDKSTGLVEGQVPNSPGAEVFGTFNGANGDPIRYTRPPDLGSDVYKVLEMLTSEQDDLGNIPGSEGRPPTTNASGQLVEELRFNADRFVAPAGRHLVTGIARLAEDWQVMLPLIWSEEKLLKVGGSDKVAQTIMVQPEMFQTGQINIVPDLESMLPEGRGEREARIWRWYQAGALGEPGMPETNALFLDLSHFPHMNREALPGGVDRSTAEFENGQLIRGAEVQPVLEWYDDAVHLLVHYRFMKHQNFLKLPIPILEAFTLHVKQHEMAMEQKMMAQVLKEATLQAQVQAILPQEQGAGGGPPGKSTGAKKPPPAAADNAAA